MTDGAHGGRSARQRTSRKVTVSKHSPRQPTTRQRKLIKGMLDGKPVAQAAREAGYADSVIPTAIYKLIRRPAFLGALGEAMDGAGITDEKLLERLREGLDATTVKITPQNGSAVEREVPDWDGRHRYLETALRLKQYLTPRSLHRAEDDPAPSVSFHFHLHPNPGQPTIDSRPRKNGVLLPPRRSWNNGELLDNTTENRTPARPAGLLPPSGPEATSYRHPYNPPRVR